MPAKRTAVMAEIGKAARGDLGRALELVRGAAAAGADAVRLPHFVLAENVHPDLLAGPAERAWSFKLELPFLGERMLGPDDYKRLAAECAALGLEVVGTPWDLPSWRLQDAAGVDRFFVNSYNAFNVPLVEAILGSGTRLYLSTGGLAEEQVKTLCARYELDRHDTVLLHSVLAYPAPASVVNLRAMDVLRRYHRAVGYSSNDLLGTTHVAAAALGAEVFVKHVHLLPAETDAHRASVPVSRLAAMIAEIRQTEELLGRAIKQESRGEMANRDIMGKGLAVRTGVERGGPLTRDSVVLQVPPRGVKAERWFEVEDRAARRDLTVGDIVYSDDLDLPVSASALAEPLGPRGAVPGKRGAVVRLKDIDEIIAGRDYDYVEVHYAAGDLDRPDDFKEYDLELVVHLPEYSAGVLLDLASTDEALRRYSVEVINRVMDKTRVLRSRFHRTGDLVKFVLHPGALTFPDPTAEPDRQYEVFVDSLARLDQGGLDVLIENMTPFPWFLSGGDWAIKQGVTTTFMHPEALAAFLEEHGHGMTLDLCHAKLWCNHNGHTLLDYMTRLKPYVRHIHFSDATGVDGEGLMIGAGEIDWQEVAGVFHDYREGWTPEIWNGHHDRGEQFAEAHRALAAEFARTVPGVLPARADG